MSAARDSLAPSTLHPWRVCTCAGPMVNTHVDGNAGHSPGCPANPHTPHEPDRMGVWSDDGIVWLPRSLYTRSQARTFYAAEIGERWIDVSVRARWMRWRPDHPDAAAYDHEYWGECKPDEPGAFQVWRCE